MRAAAARLPLGIEFQPASRDLALRLFDEGLINHVQITGPASWPASELDRLPARLPRLIHSLFLNALGDNDWTLLKEAARRLKRLRPAAVIEHFGVAVDRRGRKHAVSYDFSRSGESRRLERAVENLERWRDLVGCPVMLENVPVHREASRYFAACERVAERAAAPVSLDLPHLVVSFNACGLQPADVSSALRRLDPEHLHIGGVVTAGGRIEDNHKLVSPWLLNVVAAAGIRPRTITLEQSDQLPAAYVERQLRRIQSGDWGATPDLSLRRKTRTAAQFSEDLASGRARAWGVPASRRGPGKGARLRSRLLRTAEERYPYVYPFASMTAASGGMAVGVAVEALAKILQVSRDFGTWYFDPGSERILVRVSRGRTAHILDFEKEDAIKRMPNGARKEYTIRTRDGSEVAVFTTNGRAGENE